MTLARLILVWALISAVPIGVAGAANAPRAKRVLILHSFGRDFPPLNAVSSNFRTALVQRSAAPIEFVEASLEATLFAGAGSETPIVEYLHALSAEQPVDLLVPIGYLAVQFLQRHRDHLFLGVPLMVMAVDKRRLTGVDLGGNATVVGATLDLAGLVENILRILPNTANIEVITGNSPFEGFWLNELRRGFQRFTDRVRFNWLNELPFEDMRRRLAKLPPDSAILYFLMLKDAAGVPYEQDRALDALQRESNAPIFGVFDQQIGRGIVGGPLYANQEVSRQSAEVALRILNGAPAASIPPVFLAPAAPIYDWRELTRWKIDENRLPPGSIVRFREPSLWERYGWYIIGALAIIAAQAALIVGLFLQRSRRHRIEAELRENQKFTELSSSAGNLGLWVRDVGEGELWANSCLRSLFGFGQNDVLRFDDVLARIHPDDRAQVIANVKRAEQANGSFEDEFRVMTPSGNERWVAARGRGVDQPERNGMRKRRMGVVFDITERKLAEQEIRSLKERLEAENLYLKEEISRVKGFDEIIGNSDALKYVLMRAEQVAKADTTVLLQGETGVGKELIARAIHKKSSRSDGPYVKVNCATLPEALVESELFGHEKGAFTGADRQRKGRFELADGGTILLDEVAELSAGTQAKLLRVLQEGEFERVGGSSTIKVNVRVIAATNRKLPDEVSAGRFREDLFYRLNVYPVTITPLRERRADIPLLVSHYARQIGERFGKNITEVPAQVMREFVEYNWPGNIRELQNVIERAVIVSTNGILCLPEPLVQTTAGPLNKHETFKSTTVSPLDEVERKHILRALEATGWRIQGPKGAATMLKLHPSTLRFRMKKLGLTKSYTSQAQKSNLH